MDEAHKKTEEILKSIEKEINAEYKKASREIQQKLDDYMKRFRNKDQTWQKWVEDGVKTKKQYDEWRVGQLAIGKRWEDQKKAIVSSMAEANQIARNIVSKQMPGVYAENHNYGTFEVEKGSLIDTSYVLYDKDTVEELFTNSNLYHDPGRKTLSKVAQGLETRWNKQQVQSAMLQGILQGESISLIATRLANAVSDKNRNAAIRNARTITTGVENKGRIDSYERANKKGINTKKQWIATLDGRTRHSHRLLDGEKADVGKKFSNGCEYPGDPNGSAGEIYNCRCTLIADIEGYENDLSDRRDEKLGGMSYEEWKKAEPTFQDILHQEKLGNAIAQQYRDEYAGIIDFLKKKISGAITGALDPDGKEAEEHAIRFYEEVRHRTTDCRKIAKNTGFNVNEIKNIKNYIFIDKHYLDDGYRLFDPDYEMGQSWQRLTEGKNIQEHDIIMLKHESLERKLVSSGMSQDEAHLESSLKYNYNEALEEYYDKIGKNKRRKRNNNV